MASAVLLSRNEPCFGERKVYMRKYPNPNQTHSFINLDRNPTQKQQNPSKNQIHDPHSPPVFPSRKPFQPKETTNGRYITFKLSAYTPRELKSLKNRLITELEQVRTLKTRLETLTRPEKPIQPAHANSKKRPDPFSKSDPKRAQLDPGMEKVVKNMMKRCGQILGKIMKHKFGWVFNNPVDVEGLGLFDYYDIIKRPMDLGTVKRNLEKGVYECPSEFGVDVRLTFENAMRYNPKEHDVFLMAHQLLGKFDEMFHPAFRKFQCDKLRVSGENAGKENPGLVKEKAHCGDFGRENAVKEKANRVDFGRESLVKEKVNLVDLDGGKKVKEKTRLFDLGVGHVGEEKTKWVDLDGGNAVREKVVNGVVLEGGNVGMVGEFGGGRSGKLRKPKAREVNKRGMSYEEKAKLGREIEELPEEKMMQLFQIVRRRNGFFAQDGDEIELDMEAMDNETLWELDRFVVNHKKMVNKNKRQGFIAENEQNQVPILIENLNNPVAVCELVDAGAKGGVEEDVDIGEEIPIRNFPSVEIEKDVNVCDGGRSSSSSGATSSNSSSSSDSDSGSSSGSDSDGGSVRSPYVESNQAQTREGMN